MVTLTVYRGDRIVQELDLEGPEIRIGRGADNSVVLADDGKGVSRAHAVLRLENGSAVLYDRESQNGTFLDGKRIKRAVIQPGQDIVIGPYRLVVMSFDATDPDPGVTGTIITPRTTPPPVAAPAALPSPPDPTPRDLTPAPAQNTSSTASRRTDTTAREPIVPTPTPRVLVRRPRAVVYGAGIALAVLAAVLIWQLWPGTRPDSTRVSVTTTSTTTSVTTTIPVLPADPHAETIAQAESAMATAEDTFASKRFTTAAAQFDAVLTVLAPALNADPPPAQATDLRDRATSRATEARKLAALAKPPPPPVKDVVDPDAVVRRPEETDLDYDRRNKEAQQDYVVGGRLLGEGDYMGAVKIFEGLAGREPGWRDVSSHLKAAQDALGQARQSVLDDGLRRENAGYAALNERRFAEAASELIAASKLFERAVALQAPTADKLANENLARRRHLAKVALESARTHANNKQTTEAVKLFQLVVDVLPPGDQLRLQAESDLKRIGIGRE